MRHRSASWTAGSRVGAQGGGSAGVPLGAKTGWYATQSLPWGTRGFGVVDLTYREEGHADGPGLQRNDDRQV